LLYGGNGTVPFIESFTQPPIVLLQTFDGGGLPRVACGNRLTTVSQSSFSVVESIQVFSCWGTTQYLAIEPGIYTLSSGGQILADTVQTSSVVRSTSMGVSGPWVPYTFATPFPGSEPPSILARIQSGENLDSSTEFNYPMSASVAIRNVTNTGFEFAIEWGAAPNEGIAVSDQGVLAQSETIGFVAVSQGAFGVAGVDIDSQFVGEVTPFSSWTCDPSTAFDLASGFAFAGQSSRNNDSGAIAEVCRYLPSAEPMRVSVHTPFGSFSAPTVGDGYSLVRFSGDLLHTEPLPTIALEVDGDGGDDGHTITVDEATPGQEASFRITSTKPWLPEIYVEFSVSGPSGWDQEVVFTDQDDQALDLSQPVVVPRGAADFTIKAKAVQDDDVEGLETITISISHVVDADSRVLDIDTANSSIDINVVDDDEVGISGIPAAIELAEGGSPPIPASEQLQLQLTSQPIADVVIAFTGIDSSQFTVVPAALTIQPGNWNATMVVDIQAQDDSVADGTYSGSIAVDVTSTDEDYNHLPIAPIAVTVTDNETGGINATPSSMSIAEGGSSTLNLSLTEQPSADVQITLTSQDTSEVQLGSAGSTTPVTVTIAADASWANQRTVDVFGEDDTLVDGSAITAIGIAVSSVDGNPYNGLVVDDVAVTVTDNETGGINATPSSMSVAEGGSSALNLSLTEQPSADVQITLTSQDTSEVQLGSEGSTTPVTVTIAADASWANQRTVNVFGEDDTLVDGSATTAIGIAVSSVDGNPYNGFVVDDVAVTVTDDEVDGVDIVVSPSAVVDLDEGQSTSLGVHLSHQFAAAATVHFESPDTGKITLNGGGSVDLVFPNDGISWDDDQTLTITALNDGLADNPEDFEISASITTSDVPPLDFALPTKISVHVTDPDVALAVIGEPTGRIYGDLSEQLAVDASASTIPSGFDYWFAYQPINGSDLLGTATDFGGLVSTLSTSNQVPKYRLRLVIAAVMPDATALTGHGDPCGGAADCVFADVTILREDTPLYPFRIGTIQGTTDDYLFPTAVQLLWAVNGPDVDVERATASAGPWVAIDNAADQDQDGQADAGLVDRGLVPGATYFYRIRLEESDEWLYHGNTAESPGDPVVTPQWTAPQIVPVFESVEWDCPEDASRFLCEGTATVLLTPEDPTESLAGHTVHVFVNEPTFEARDGLGAPMPVQWPAEYPVVAGDEPACVEKKSPGDDGEGVDWFYHSFAIPPETIPPEDRSWPVQIPHLRYGAQGFRFVVDDGAGGTAERAVLVGVGDEVGQSSLVFRSPHPLLYGLDLSSSSLVFDGLGPANPVSPDCSDAHYSPDKAPPLGTAFYVAGEFCITDGPLPGCWDRTYLIDEQGLWEWDDPSSSFDAIWYREAAGPSTGFTGRKLAPDDGGADSVWTLAAEVGSSGGYVFSDLVVDSTASPPYGPTLSFVPTEAFTDSSDGLATVPVWFRITDLDHDVNLDSVVVSNLSVDQQPSTKGWFASRQYGSSLEPMFEDRDWGWFVAEVPMQVGTNELSFEAEDDNENPLSSELGTTRTVTRSSPEVRAVISSATPSVAEPGQMIVVDATDTMASWRDEGGEAVAKWLTCERAGGSTWWSHCTTQMANNQYVTGSHQLNPEFAMPQNRDLKIRLVVAASEDDFFALGVGDGNTLPCTYATTEGRCDTAEIEIPLSDSDCYALPNDLSVEILDSNGVPINSQYQYYLNPGQTLDFSMSVPEGQDGVPDDEEIFYRWYAFRTNQPDGPYFYLSPGPQGWSAGNSQLHLDPAALNLPLGEFIFRGEARIPGDGCLDPGVTGWWLGIDSGRVRVTPSLDGIAPGQIVQGQGETIRFYSRSWEAGTTGRVKVQVSDYPVDNLPTTWLLDIEAELSDEGDEWFVEVDADQLPQPDVLAPGTEMIYRVEVGEGSLLSARYGGLLKMIAAGSDDEPLLAEAEAVCAGIEGLGTECVNHIMPGQVMQGSWDSAGDHDYFAVFAGQGTEIKVTLKQVEGSLPPDASKPEVWLIPPDNVIVDQPVTLTDGQTEATLQTTLLMSGQYTIEVANGPAFTDYLITVEVVSESLLGSPTFAYSTNRVHVVAAPSGATLPDASLRAMLFDGFGHPLSAANMDWEEGDAATSSPGTFIPTGVVTTRRSANSGMTVLDIGDPDDPQVNDLNTKPDQLWRPNLPVLSMGQAKSGRLTTSPTRLTPSDRTFAPLSLANINGDVARAGMPRTVAGAREILKRLEELPERPMLPSKAGGGCDPPGLTCDQATPPEYRATVVDLGTLNGVASVDIEFIGADVTDDGNGGSEIYGIEVQSETDVSIQVTLDDGENRTMTIDNPMLVTALSYFDAALEESGATCDQLVIPGDTTGSPSSFTYIAGDSTDMDYEDLDQNGEPCCWDVREYLTATLVVHAVKIVNGQASAVEVFATDGVAVKPKPKEPCTLWPYPPLGDVADPWAVTRQVGNNGPWEYPSGSPYLPHEQTVGWVYATDECGNPVYLPPAPAGSQRIDSTDVFYPSPEEEEEGNIEAVVYQGAGSKLWLWRVMLESWRHATGDPNVHYIPDGGYSLDLFLTGGPTCNGSSVATTYDINMAPEKGVFLVGTQAGWFKTSAPMIDPDSGSLKTWRVRAAMSNSIWGDHEPISTETEIYVAKVEPVFATDGSIEQTLVPVDDVELCVGDYHLHIDDAADIWDLTKTCYPIGASATTVLAVTETVPDAGGFTVNDPTFNGVIGTSVGIARTPSDPGIYALVAEPIDEAYRRGEAWQVEETHVLIIGGVPGPELWTVPIRYFGVSAPPKPPDLDCDECTDCEEGVGARNGNFRSESSDPVAGMPTPFTTRVYNSLPGLAQGGTGAKAAMLESLDEASGAPPMMASELSKVSTTAGYFGAGWFSAYDATVEETTIGSTQWVEITLEDSTGYVFEWQDGAYHQYWPVDNLRSTLTENAGEYTFERDGDRYARTYAGGVLTTLTEISTGRTYTIQRSGGHPNAVVDSWRGQIASISVNGDGRIESVTPTNGATVTYAYTGGGGALDTVSIGSAGTLRDYGYDVARTGLLTTIQDGAANTLKEVSYVNGLPTQVKTPNRVLESLQWGVTPSGEARAPDEGESVMEVVSATGAVTTYYLRELAGHHRIVEIVGDCACSGNDRVYDYDAFGHRILEQDARGYITYREFEPDGSLMYQERGLYPSGCNPADYPEAPGYCRLTPSQLRDHELDLLGFDPAAYERVTYTYPDPATSEWPDKPESVCRASVFDAAPDSCTRYTYDPVTGETLTITQEGATGTDLLEPNPTLESRTTTRTFYNGESDVAAFDPGISAPGVDWLNDIQPPKLMSVDGPRPLADANDQTKYVYYPDHVAVDLDDRGQLAAVMDPNGFITRYQNYNANGSPQSVIAPDGVTTNYTYDDLGRVLTATIQANAGCTTLTDSRCGTNLVTTTTYKDATGPVESVSTFASYTLYSYDSQGRVTTIDRGPSFGDLRERTESVYEQATGLKVQDSLWRLEDSTWVEKSRTEYIFRPSGQLDSTVRPRFDGDTDPAIETTTYGPTGLVIGVKDANHDRDNLKYTYDGLGRLTTVEQLKALGATADDDVFIATSYAYDRAGNLTKVTDANGNETTYVIDDFGQTTKIDSPVTGVTTFTYLPSGQLDTKTDAAGTVFDNDYDDGGRLESTTIGSETLTYDYDEAGRRTESTVTSTGVVQTYEHDRRGAVTVATLKAGTSAQVHTTEYTYNQDGALEKIEYPSGRIVTHTPDFAGRPESITTTPFGGSTSPVVSNIDYLPGGPVESMVLGPEGSAAITESRGHDWQYRRTGHVLTDALATNVMDLTLDYDPVGNLDLVTDTVGMPDRTADYDYDELGRLTGVSWPGGTGRVYSYDDIGNLTDLTVTGEGAVTYGYVQNLGSKNSPKLATITTSPSGVQQVLTTDTRGNVEEDDVSTYTYDDRNLLSQRVIGSDTSAYTFGADGRRVSAAPGAGNTFDIILGPGGNRLAKGDGTTWREYIWLGNQLVGFADDGGAPVTVVTDHIGMPIQTFDSSGVPAWDARTEPYGALRDQTKLIDDPGLRYPGQWQDELAIDGSCDGNGLCTMPGPLEQPRALYENGFRWYRADWGRYTQADPLGLAGGLNLYSYSGWNPKANIDPDGLAYFAKRKLEGSGKPTCDQVVDVPIATGPAGIWEIILYLLGDRSNSVSVPTDPINQEILHEQLFFEDGKSPKNLGFFNSDANGNTDVDGMVREEITDPKILSWACKEGGYNDCVMRKAVAKVGHSGAFGPGTYCLTGEHHNNCQDWAAAVRAAYWELKR
jgi:RHS repeat-associated protein